MNAKQKRQMKALFKALDIIADEYEGMPLRQAMAFLSVAINEADYGAAELKDVGRDTRAPAQVVSRDLLGLGKRARSGAPGLGLIETYEDFQDLRRKPYRLTKAGHTLIKQLSEAL